MNCERVSSQPRVSVAHDLRRCSLVVEKLRSLPCEYRSIAIVAHCMVLHKLQSLVQESRGDYSKVTMLDNVEVRTIKL